jgi:hypothetical protein
MANEVEGAMRRGYIFQLSDAYTLLFGIIALPLSTHASPVLDQNHTITSSIGETPSDAQEAAQTFTIGITGTLAQIDVLLGRFGFASGDAQFTVYSTASGFPSGNLGAVAISAASVPTTGPIYIPVDLTSLNIAVTTNDVLAFGIKNTGSGPYLMPYVSPPPPTYSGGSGVRRTLSVPPGPWQTYTPERDFGFRTYVEPTAPIATPGDFNDDGTIDAADYIVWRKNLNDPSEAALNGNGDGANGIDEGDYNLWRENFAESASGQGAPVPEPSACLLSTIALLGAMFTARRGHVHR